MIIIQIFFIVLVYLVFRELKKDTRDIVLIIALFAIANAGFGFAYWELKTTIIIRYFGVVLFLIWLISPKPDTKQNFRNYVLLLAFLPFLSIFSTLTLYRQTILSSITMLTSSLVWLFYFALHHWKVKETTILKAFLSIALFVAATQIIQQFTHPIAFFGVEPDEEALSAMEIPSSRNGLWRFRIGHNGFYTAIALFALWVNVNLKMKKKHMLIIGILLVSIYLTLTRQVIFSVILTLFLSFFINKEKVKLWSLLLGLTMIAGLFLYADVLFGEFAKMTREDASKEYVRVLEAKYFWDETFHSILTIYFGHGIAHSGEFARLQQELRETYHFFTSDVGFIGQMWHYGIIYVMVCYDLLLTLFFKWKNVIPMYVRLFVLFTSFMSIMIFPFTKPVSHLIWCFLLYICDIHINQSTKLKP